MIGFASMARTRITPPCRPRAGRRAWYDHGGLGRLLPVGNSSDLVVMADLAEGDLTEELAGEIARVLHPWYGVALLGGEVEREAMERWGEAFDGLGLESRIVEGEAGEESDAALTAAFPGVLLRVGKPALPGADNWSHYWGGPGNNPVSGDTAYSYPETIQWTGLPYGVTRLDWPIVADGRLFMIWSGYLLDATRNEPVLPGEEVALTRHGWGNVGLHVRRNVEYDLEDVRGPLLEARAVGSGARLWSRRMSPAMWLQVSRSVVVANGDRLLVGDGNTLRVLDQATGEERLSLEMDYEEIKWIAVAEGRLAVLGGPDINRFPERMRRTDQNVPLFRSRGHFLTVLDAESLEAQWEVRREEGPEVFDPRSAAIDDGRLFLCTDGGRAEAYSLETGELQWRREGVITLGREVSYLWDRVSRHLVSGFAMAGLYILSASEIEPFMVISQEDGRPMWELEQGTNPFGRKPFYFQNQLWVGSVGRDPVTGEEKRNVPARVGGCGHFMAAPQGIVGMDGLTWDAVADSTAPTPPFPKSACGPSSFVANGLIWRVPNGCGHLSEWQGFIVRAPAEQNLPSPGTRLVRSVDPASPVAGEEEAAGWTDRRGNVARSNSSDASVADTAALLWSIPAAKTSQIEPADGTLLGAGIRMLPPVTAGDVVVAAGHDGSIRALELQSGDELWRAHTAGRIESSPAIWKDRVFAGSTDGWLYAFSQGDGRELWRLRVAPEEGRMMYYDQLGSRWPVLGSPLAADGKVFAVAGITPELEGMHAIAADAVTGELLWETSDWRSAAGEKVMTRYAAGSGQFCWDAEFKEAVFRPGEGVPVRFSADDGSARAVFGEGHFEEFESYPSGGPGSGVTRAWRGTQLAGGQEIGSMGRGWMVLGGRRMLDNSLAGVTSFVPQKDKGAGRFPILTANWGRGEGCSVMPSWDDTDVLLTLRMGRSPQMIVLVARARLAAFLQSQIPAEEAQEIADVPTRFGAHLQEIVEGMLQGVNLPEHLEELGGWSAELSSWRVSAYTTAITPNAALVLTRDGRGEPRLTAFNRVDGGILWEMELPANAIHDGLAVASDGSIILALEDGRILRIGASDRQEQ